MPTLLQIPSGRARKFSLGLILLVSGLSFGACASLQPPSATGPRVNDQLYPILFSEDSHAHEATLAALNRLGQSSGKSNGKEAKLQPATGTIVSLPASITTALYLPKLGSGASMNEEETREALRRFIRKWQELIGSDPAKLSLVERTDRPDGSKLASYEQRAFRYPLRGNYGQLQIQFAGDGRVFNLTSTCIPDAEKIQNALSALNIRLKAEDVQQQLREQGITYAGDNGNSQRFSVPPSGEISVRGLTTYVIPAKNQPAALEFHLAWEVELPGAPVRRVYVDAINGETVAAE